MIVGLNFICYLPTLFAHSSLIRSIDLAPVCLSNTHILWHSRFNHSYAEWYSVSHESLLLVIGAWNIARILCSHTGLGPVRTYVRRENLLTTSRIDHKFYPMKKVNFDASISLEVETSTSALITYNTYCLIICSSLTQMYFDNYTKLLMTLLFWKFERVCRSSPQLFDAWRKGLYFDANW
jgi:hypothetical protein